MTKEPCELADVAGLGDICIEGVYRLGETIADIGRHYGLLAAAGVMHPGAGGDHSITLPVMRARAAGGSLDLIHFDAHWTAQPPCHGKQPCSNPSVSSSGHVRDAE